MKNWLMGNWGARPKTLAPPLGSPPTPANLFAAVNAGLGLPNHAAQQANMAALMPGRAAAAQMIAGMAQNSLYQGYPGLHYKPDPAYPNTLGWRSWIWDLEERKLYSPHHHTVWEAAELRCDTWDEAETIRGVAGIHALLVPEGWKELVGPSDPAGGYAYLSFVDGRPGIRIGVTGIVERFGKYVLGSEGWRAEWVMIRALKAPTEEIGLDLEKAFPDVEVIYGDR